MKRSLPISDHLDACRVAALLDMSPRFVKNAVKRGDLLGYRVGGRVLVDGDSLRSFLRARQIGQTNIVQAA